MRKRKALTDMQNSGSCDFPFKGRRESERDLAILCVECDLEKAITLKSGFAMQ
jgi:hypothetical protein